MLTTERLKKDRAEIEAHIAAIARQVQIMHGAKSALDQLITVSEADDIDRKAAEEEAEKAMAEDLDKPAEPDPDDIPDAPWGPDCTDPGCVLCHPDRAFEDTPRPEPVIEQLTGPAGRVDPGEVAVAMKDEHAS